MVVVILRDHFRIDRFDEVSNVHQRVHHPPGLIFQIGTRVVTRVDIFAPNGRVQHPNGSVGVVVGCPVELEVAYRVRFLDGYEDSLHPDQLAMLAEMKQNAIGNTDISAAQCNLYERVILRCIIGSQAYGLADEQSDVDRRGIYLPPADLHWSLYGVPEQLESHERQETYWELQKFLILALKANPNVLECLYSPLIEQATPLARELLEIRELFLSRLVYQTYNGYVHSQFKKMQADIRNNGTVKWKHVMHLIRLLISGTCVLREGYVPVRVDEHREQLLAIKRGQMPWEETEKWRLNLHGEFDRALVQTKLPERPDYERANAFLLKARSLARHEELP